MFSLSTRRVANFAKTKARSIRWKSSSPVAVHPPLVIPSNPSPRSLIWPGIFTVAFTGGCFGLVSILTYHGRHGHQKQMIELAPAWARDGLRTVASTPPILLLLGPLVAANVGVYGCWKVFPHSTTMFKYFLTYCRTGTGSANAPW